jgi:hypothetical protein
MRYEHFVMTARLISTGHPFEGCRVYWCDSSRKLSAKKALFGSSIKAAFLRNSNWIMKLDHETFPSSFSPAWLSKIEVGRGPPLEANRGNRAATGSRPKAGKTSPAR